MLSSRALAKALSPGWISSILYWIIRHPAWSKQSVSISEMISISSVVNSAFFTLGLKSHAPKDGTKLGVKVGLENVKSPDMNN